MRSFLTRSVTARVALLGIAGWGVAGCAQASRTGSASSPTLSASTAGSAFRVVASRAPSIVEARTASLALDRIDQRQLPLDRSFRRAHTGAGVTVYVFDGGILAGHPEFGGRVRRGYDAFPNDPAICNAHGTAVAGAIGGRTLGVAGDVDIVDVKIVECGRLRGTIEGIVKGVHWVLQDARERGGRPAIVNWSFMADTNGRIGALDEAVRLLTAAGIPVIVSAGNVAMDACRISPANARGAFVVGASSVRFARMRAGTVARDYRTPNTAWGQCIDVYAPGDSVLLPSMDEERRPMSQLWQGTSMSAGYVSGAAALLLEQHPHATPEQVYEHLRTTATPDVVRDTRAPFARMLYVGTQAERLPQTRVAVR